MTKMLYSLIGTVDSCWKTAANLSKPRPLLVVHSGKTTSGRSTVRLMSSRDSAFAVGRKGGTEPVACIIESREMGLKPRIRERAVGVRMDGEEIAAEPVPVRRPGVRVTGLEVEDIAGESEGSHAGNTNMGSNLVNQGENGTIKWLLSGNDSTEMLTILFLSRKPSWKR
jgi:hypothetical protein